MVQANPGFQDHMFAMYTGASLKQMGGARGASADLGGSQGVGELSCSSMWRKSGILTLSPCRSFWHPPWWRCHRRVNYCSHSLPLFSVSLLSLSLSLSLLIAQYNCGCDCAEAFILSHTLRETSGCGVAHDPHPPAACPFPSLHILVAPGTWQWPCSASAATVKRKCPFDDRRVLTRREPARRPHRPSQALLSV